MVFHRRDIGVSQVVLHSLHSLEQPWKTCCMKDAMNHQENGLVWNCSSFLATYCPLLFHVWHRLLGWAPGAHPVPFPHISLPPSNTAHPEQRKNINFIWRKKKKRSSPASEQLIYDPAPCSVTASEQRAQCPPIQPFKQMTSEGTQLCTLNGSHHQWHAPHLCPLLFSFTSYNFFLILAVEIVTCAGAKLVSGGSCWHFWVQHSQLCWENSALCSVP